MSVAAYRIPGPIGCSDRRPPGMSRSAAGDPLDEIRCAASPPLAQDTPVPVVRATPAQHLREAVGGQAPGGNRPGAAAAAQDTPAVVPDRRRMDMREQHLLPTPM